MTTSSSDLNASLSLFQVKPGLTFSIKVLTDILPDIETTLFFGKVYELNYSQLADLLRTLHNTDLVSALFGEGNQHSNDLQDYLVDITQQMPGVHDGDIVYAPDIPHGEILPEMWDQLNVEVASSIKEVAEKLQGVVGMLPGKQGRMTFRSLMEMNKRRPTMGDHRAVIQHERQQQNLLILDVSGSMTEGTIRRIIADVVALSYQANAHLAIVSNSCYYWEPGTYDVDTVLQRCEFGGTHYETLAPLFERTDWGVVITVADYDSSDSAAQYLAAHATGTIEKVVDISLVNRPTFLAHCIGQFAKSVQPILVGNSTRVLRG